MKLRGKAKAAFLRRMEQGRAKRRAKHRPAKRRHHKRRHPKHARSTRRHHHHTSEAPPMAKRRHHKRHTTHKKKKHHSKGGGRGKSLLRGLVPTMDEAIAAGAAGAYGFLEGAAAKDKDHFLAKMPVPIASLGRCGTAGVGLWIIGALAKRRFIRAMARGVVDVAAYQLLRRATPFGKAGEKDVEFTLSGIGGCGDRRTPLMVDRHLQALDDDGDDDGDD